MFYEIAERKTEGTINLFEDDEQCEEYDGFSSAIQLESGGIDLVIHS